VHIFLYYCHSRDHCLFSFLEILKAKDAQRYTTISEMEQTDQRIVMFESRLTANKQQVLEGVKTLKQEIRSISLNCEEICEEIDEICGFDTLMKQGLQVDTETFKCKLHGKLMLPKDDVIECSLWTCEYDDDEDDPLK